MISIIFSSVLLFNSSNVCDLTLPEQCDIWKLSGQKYASGDCPNTRPYCEIQEPDQQY